MKSIYALDSRLRKKLEGLKPTPGYCIFIDVVDSVALKDRGLGAWCDVMHNLSDRATSWLGGLDADCKHAEHGLYKLVPLKIIGDCLMFYIPRRSMPAGADALTIFDALLNVVRAPDEPEVHVAVSACRDAYEITFVDGVEDIHGRDIDLTARLVKEAGPQELIMNGAFYFEAATAFRNWREAGNVRKADDGYMQFANVQGPWTTFLKSFKQPESLYKWCGRK